MPVDPIDRRLLQELETGLPLIPEPFHEIGNQLGISGEEVLDRLNRLRTEGVIRKFRARINQRLIGISANALVAWNPAGSGNGDAGTVLGSYPGVTHCYERSPVPGKWDYTFYTVHHGYSRDQVLGEVATISRETGILKYVVLFSTREFKRVPDVRIRDRDAGNGSEMP